MRSAAASTLALALTMLAIACAPEAPPVAPPPPTAAPPPPVAEMASTPARPTGPPAAAVRPVVDTYFGQQVTDDYRWMETPDSPELATWMKAQADYTRSQLDALKTRAELAARIHDLDVKSGDRIWNVQTWGGRWFYMKRPAGMEMGKLYVRDDLSKPERLLVDPEALASDAKHFALDWFAPSLDGSKVAYGVSPSGSEDSVLHVLETATGKDLKDSITRSQFGSVAWIDGKSFFHVRLQKLAPGAAPTDKYKNATSYLHVLGTDPDADPAILGAGVTPAVPVSETEIGIVLFTPGAPRWVFGLVADGVRNEQTLYVAPRAKLAGAKTPWTKLFDKMTDDVTSFDARGDDIYFLTHKDALRFKIQRASLAHPDVAHAQTIVPESNVVLRSLGVAKDGLYVQVLDAGIGRVERVPFAGGKVETLPLPLQGSIDGFFTHFERPGAVITAESWTTSRRALAWDGKTRSFADTKLVAPSPVEAEFASVVAEEVTVPSTDGASVPLSIVAPKGLAKDGSHPTWLDGYGAYGITNDPGFAPTHLAWFERGGVNATCHVRGGGENGEGWHRSGMLLQKQHTIDDFLACARYLVDQKYTSPGKLAGEGTSAGGILIGGAITQRPDLFGAAIIRVGVSNVLRFEQTLNVLNVPEFGSVKTEEGFRALFGADAYSHVKDGTPYPAVLLTTGATDPRVAPWQVTKMAARLQAATSSKKPVLLRVDYDAGHGMGSTASQRDAELADEYAFLLAQLGG